MNTSRLHLVAGLHRLFAVLLRLALLLHLLLCLFSLCRVVNYKYKRRSFIMMFNVVCKVRLMHGDLSSVCYLQQVCWVVCQRACRWTGFFRASPAERRPSCSPPARPSRASTTDRSRARTPGPGKHEEDAVSEHNTSHHRCFLSYSSNKSFESGQSKSCCALLPSCG